MEPLRKGQACLNCRERRTRCDGVRPKCRKCRHKDVKCVYVEMSTRKEALEEEVVALQHRLAQLQSLSSRPRIKLADPAWTPEGWWATDEPPLPLRRFLFETFMPFTTTLTFFLNPERLARAFYTPAPFDDISRPSPALISAIYLWGIVISGSPTLVTHEPIFFSRAVYHASNPGEFSCPQLAKYTVQAELLIVHYLYRMRLTAEGKVHSNTAFKLALREGLHKVRGAQIPELTSFTDAIELGENMNAIWMAFMVDTCIACIYGDPTVCPDQDSEEGRIDMPWPLDMAQYEKGLLPPETMEEGTLTNFISNAVSSYANEEVSFIAMECQAVTLLKRATAFTASWDPVSANPTHYAEFLYLNQRIDKFLETISPVLSYDENKIRRFQLILVHCLTHVATINLNVSPSWTYKSIDAATKIVHLFDNFELREIRFLHCIMGNFWDISGQVLFAEYSRLIASPENGQHLEKLIVTLNRLKYVLKVFSNRCPSINGKYQLFKSKCKQLGDADGGLSASS